MSNISQHTHNNRMQPDFGELALPSAADARRYVINAIPKIPSTNF
jgi:hypothetical protein